MFAPTSPVVARRRVPLWTGVPLFWRLVLVNLVVVLGGALVGTWLTQRLVLSGSFTPLTHAILVLSALVVSAALTMALLRETFRPIRSLRAVIQRFNAGDPAARATLEPFTDPDVAALVIEMNALWDRLDADAATIREKTEQAERLAAQVISAQEEERRRIARELHDEAGQALTMLIVGLERGEQSMPGEHLAAARATVRRLRDLATQTLEEIRNLALDLRPALLDDLGLVAAVRWYARTFAARAGLPVDVALDGLDESDRLPPDVETAVFQIVQEGITNAVKHARAGRVWVGLHRDEGGLTVRVADDGVGLPPFEAANGDRGGRLGLFGMAERA